MTQPTATVTREKLLQEFNTVVADTEQLLKSTAAASGEKASAWRESVEQKLKAAKEKLVQLEETAVVKTKAAAQATDTYVHEKPWQAIGITAGVSVVVGVALGLMLNRR